MDYSTPDNLSEQELDVAYWWVQHRNQLRKWWVASLAGLDILLFIFLLYSVLTLVIRWPAHIRMIESIGKGTIPVSVIPSPADLAVSKVALSGTRMLASIGNTNSDWLAQEITYHFAVDYAVDAKVYESKTLFLYPNETRHISDVVDQIESVKDATVFVDAITWEKLTADDIATIPSFDVTEVLYKTVEIDGGGTGALVSAKITNQSSRDFLQVPVDVVFLSQSDDALALRQQVIPSIDSLETVDFVLRLSTPVTGTRKLLLQPTVNIF